MSLRSPAALGVVLALTAIACRTTPGADDIRSATAEMRSPTGDRHGILTISRTTTGVRIDGVLVDVPPGTHGIHFHTIGRCDPPGFESAGAHINPTNAEHGLDNPRGPHAGDLPNAVANTAGRMIVDVATTRVTLSTDAGIGLFDADGSALIIHAAADDQRTSPAGASGARIACGVIVRGG